MPAAGLADEPPGLQPRTILTLEVRGSGPKMRLPRSLPAWDPPMLPVARRRRFEFTVSRDPMNEFLSFGIDGKQFELRNKPYRAKLNTAEEWTLVDACDNKLMDTRTCTTSTSTRSRSLRSTGGNSRRRCGETRSCSPSVRVTR